MALALGLCVAVLAAGLGVLRPLGLAKGLLGIGLAPAAGLALISVLTTWSTLLGARPLLGALLLVACALSGFWAAVRERASLRFVLALRGEQRLALLALAASLVISAINLSVAFGSLQVPLSTHDGAYHVETIEAVRAGQGWQGWYPPGYHAALAAFLGLVPWVDSAVGTLQASLGLTLLGQLGMFRLGLAFFRRPLVAGAGALILSMTYQYPYTVHIWALWPMVYGLILVLALWAAAQSYLETPDTGLAVLCGLLAAGVGLTHTIEVYTFFVGLPFILAGHWQRVRWVRLARDVGIAVGLAFILFLPYIPPLLTWAHGGGAIAAGATTGSTSEGRLGLTGDLAVLMVDLTAGFLVDAPPRLLLVALGVWCALRTSAGRAVSGMAVAFLLVPLAFVYMDFAPIQWVFAATFPWSHAYRLLMVAALLLALLGGAGLVHLGEALVRSSRGLPRSGVGRLLVKACVAVGLLVGLASLVLVPQRLAAEGAHDAVYLADDAAAMAWLRQHAAPGDILVNDWASDAGIWASFKGGVRVLLPRLDRGERLVERVLVADNVAELEAVPDAQKAACALGVKYVYVGAATTAFWEPHRFPTRDRLRQSAALEEVFTGGSASVFRVRLEC